MSRKGMTLRELEVIWYQRLAESGFEEIEETHLPGRPLKEWHSFLFTQEQSQLRKKHAEDYLKELTAFYHRTDLEDVWISLVSHGNCTFNTTQAKQILELHLRGMTEREISKLFQICKTSIHHLLKRIRAWAKLA